ncbi:hypothetical protein [Chryseobacterium sp. BIGb0232]|uniref:hypothetical protein n=1 Tax=Chryseobacterium sp. BIGb0232 TaxID=2940598 RepID=UPI0011CE4697|nr:hypothetical protein [Chryseobacterium sp. BIGb0232]MCS4303047.1 hypothetical protein [Chryseobacterium sp. BIGb0232]
MRTPKSGEHHDLYEIENVLEEIIYYLNHAEIEYKDLFINADSGFDSVYQSHQNRKPNFFNSDNRNQWQVFLLKDIPVPIIKSS